MSQQSFTVPVTGPLYPGCNQPEEMHATIVIPYLPSLIPKVKIKKTQSKQNNSSESAGSDNLNKSEAALITKRKTGGKKKRLRNSEGNGTISEQVLKPNKNKTNPTKSELNNKPKPGFDQPEEMQAKITIPQVPSLIPITRNFLSDKVKRARKQSKKNSATIAGGESLSKFEAAPSKQKTGRPSKKLRKSGDIETNSKNVLNPNNKTNSTKSESNKNSKQENRSQSSSKSGILANLKSSKKAINATQAKHGMCPKSGVMSVRKKNLGTLCDFCCLRFSNVEKFVKHNKKMHAHKNLYF